MARPEGDVMYPGKEWPSSYYLPTAAKRALEAAAKRTKKSESDVIAWHLLHPSRELTKNEADAIAAEAKEQQQQRKRKPRSKPRARKAPRRGNAKIVARAATVEV
jgi:hypothetical protein